jgi:hypothetical protein
MSLTLSNSPEPREARYLHDKPENRLRESTGNPTLDKMWGILIGFASVFKERDEHIDILTLEDSVAEIKELLDSPDINIEPSEEARERHYLTTPPESRLRESTGDPTLDKIWGILIGFASVFKERDEYIDIITLRESVEELKDLIREYKESQV